jgi:hypothetical protein
MTMSHETLVDVDTLRTLMRDKYRDVADLPDRAVESFAGVGNPFSLLPRRVSVSTDDCVRDSGSHPS